MKAKYLSRLILLPLTFSAGAPYTHAQVGVSPTNTSDSGMPATNAVSLTNTYQVVAAEHDRDSEGRLLLGPELIRGLKLGNAWTRIVISQEIRRMLEEEERLIGLQFREAVPREQKVAECGPFWELESSLVLPKMSNADQLRYVGMRGAPSERFDGDYSRMIFVEDPPYRSGEIHYRRNELVRIGEFDIANTFELYRQPHKVLVISQRFWQTCRTRGIPLSLEPVRIDAG